MEEYQKLPQNIRAQLLQYSVQSGQPLMGLLQQYLIEKSNQGERTPPLGQPQITDYNRQGNKLGGIGQPRIGDYNRQGNKLGVGQPRIGESPARKYWNNNSAGEMALDAANFVPGVGWGLRAARGAYNAPETWKKNYKNFGNALGGLSALDVAGMAMPGLGLGLRAARNFGLFGPKEEEEEYLRGGR